MGHGLSLEPCSPRTPPAVCGSDGFTVAELLTTMGLTGVLGALLMSFMFQALDTSSDITARTTEVNAVNLAMERMIRPISMVVDPDGHTGSLQAVEVATEETARFYAALGTLAATPVADAPPTLVTLRLDTGSGTLHQTLTAGVRAADGSLSWPESGRRDVLLAEKVAANPEGRPLLRYLSQAEAAADTAPAISSLDTTLAHDRDLIAGVLVEVTIGTGDAAHRPTTVSSRVALINRRAA